MRSKLLIAAGLGLLAIIALVSYTLTSTSPAASPASSGAEQPAASPAQPNQTTGPTAAPATDSPAATSQPGSYDVYSSDSLSAAGQNQRVLFFHAPWCPQCRQLEADIERGVPSGVAIFKVDYDSNQALRRQYGVVQQTTVVLVDANGAKIRSYLPYSQPSLANALSGLGL